MTITQIIEQMVEIAGEEKGIEYDVLHTDEVLHMLGTNYGILINDDAPINWQLMNVIADTVREWQNNIK